jgi:hypothetical protein
MESHPAIQETARTMNLESLKKKEERKRDAAYDPVARWQHIQQTITRAEANLPPAPAPQPATPAQALPASETGEPHIAKTKGLDAARAGDRSCPKEHQASGRRDERFDCPTLSENCRRPCRTKPLQNRCLNASSERRASLTMCSDLAWRSFAPSASANGCKARMRLIESTLMVVGRRPDAWTDWTRTRG